MMNWQAKIDLTTGDLLAFGYTDFTSDGSFDAASEVVVVSYQEGLIAKTRQRIAPHHRWVGTEWLLVGLSIGDLKRRKVYQLELAVTSILRRNYPKERNDALIFVLDDAISLGLINRVAHIRTKNAWGMEILQFYADEKATIEALVTKVAVDSYEWDFESLMKTDPMITVPSALAIGD